MRQLGKVDEWNRSYENRDNFVWYPEEEIIRFVSKYYRKRIGIKEFKSMSFQDDLIGLDYGAGIGRHMLFLEEMGITAYGVDISEVAKSVAVEWFDVRGNRGLAERYFIAEPENRLPFEANSIDLVVSHGVLDSMPFEMAVKNMIELSRVIKKDGLFCFDLISGDDSFHCREYMGEEIVTTEHENGTFQSFYNYVKIMQLLDGSGFEVEEVFLKRKTEILQGYTIARYHLIVRRV